MFTFLLVVQAIIAACLVTVILMQRSEGGGLGINGAGGICGAALNLASIVLLPAPTLPDDPLTPGVHIARRVTVTGG